MSDPFGVSKGMSVKNYLKLRKVAREGPAGKAKDFAQAKYKLRYHPRRDAVDDQLHAGLKTEMKSATETLYPKRARNRKAAFGTRSQT